METIRWLYGLQHFGIKLGLENIRRLLELLGRPERQFPSVLVAGTNGKGSVAAMLHAMLDTAGVAAGLFTSPHLVRPNERIRIAEHDIADDDLDRLLRFVRERIEEGLGAGKLETHPSFFEVVTATALLAFCERGVRAAVLEVGLGGRLDATNAVSATLATIVSIDFDHVKTLGPTIAEIAAEKAGIVKDAVPLVHGVVRQQALDVIRRRCRATGSPCHDARLEVDLVESRGDVFTLATRERRYPDLRLSLAGRHQIDNARIALAAFERFAPAVGVTPDPDSVRRALGAVRWPGRLQWLGGDGARPDLLLDGAHNPAGMDVLARYLATLGRPAPVALVGAMTGKLLDGMFRTLAPHVASLVVARPGVERAEDPQVVAAQARRQGARRVEVVERPAQALARSCALTSAGGYVLVTGSLYLVGEILGLLEGRHAPGPVSH